MKYKDFWIRLFGITLCFYTHCGKTWSFNKKRFTMPDSIVGSYDIWFVVNTPYLNFCICNYLQKKGSNEF